MRQQKTDAAGAEVPKTSMRAIRNALRRLRALEEPLWDPEQVSIWVDGDGEVLVRGPGGPETVAGGRSCPAPSTSSLRSQPARAFRGPNLAVPRPELRIVPGRLSGSPHVVHTRLETRALFALRRDGLTDAAIRALYPYLTEGQLSQALDLEEQLEANLAVHVAA